MFDTLVQEGKIQLASTIKTPSVDTAAISQAVIQEVRQGLAQTVSQAVEESIKAAMPDLIAQLQATITNAVQTEVHSVFNQQHIPALQSLQPNPPSFQDDFDDMYAHVDELRANPYVLY